MVGACGGGSQVSHEEASDTLKAIREAGFNEVTFRTGAALALEERPSCDPEGPAFWAFFDNFDNRNRDTLILRYVAEVIAYCPNRSVESIADELRAGTGAGRTIVLQQMKDAAEQADS